MAGKAGRRQSVPEISSMAVGGGAIESSGLAVKSHVSVARSIPPICGMRIDRMANSAHRSVGCCRNTACYFVTVTPGAGSDCNGTIRNFDSVSLREALAHRLRLIPLRSRMGVRVAVGTGGLFMRAARVISAVTLLAFLDDFFCGVLPGCFGNNVIPVTSFILVPLFRYEFVREGGMATETRRLSAGSAFVIRSVAFVAFLELMFSLSKEIIAMPVIFFPNFGCSLLVRIGIVAGETIFSRFHFPSNS